MGAIHVSLDALMENIAAELVGYRDRIRKVIADISDEDVTALAAMCRREAQPTDSHNFAMPEWGDIAEQLESELRIRRVIKHAEERRGGHGST
jgi:hypothetical protein